MHAVSVIRKICICFRQEAVEMLVCIVEVRYEVTSIVKVGISLVHDLLVWHVMEAYPIVQENLDDYFTTLMWLYWSTCDSIKGGSKITYWYKIAAIGPKILLILRARIDDLWSRCLKDVCDVFYCQSEGNEVHVMQKLLTFSKILSKKKKLFVCPFMTKMRRVGRSIFFFL